MDDAIANLPPSGDQAISSAPPFPQRANWITEVALSGDIGEWGRDTGVPANTNGMTVGLGEGCAVGAIG